ncbi:hypothetical protein DXZ75_19540 [Streptomyces sp. AcE210]|nr:hypothetical protein DXZ75_19540 [Streptomyces sp. AcE210]
MSVRVWTQNTPCAILSLPLQRGAEPPQVWADSAHAGQLVHWAGDRLWLTLRTVSRPRGARGFVILPRRWKVERTIVWLMKARRNARNYERLPQRSEAHLNWSLITFMARCLALKRRARPQSHQKVQWVLPTSASSA